MYPSRGWFFSLRSLYYDILIMFSTFQIGGGVDRDIACNRCNSPPPCAYSDFHSFPCDLNPCEPGFVCKPCFCSCTERYCVPKNH